MRSKTAHEPETSWEIRKHTVWKRLWSLNIKLKLKHFLWRCLQNALPANETLFKRIGKGSNICSCCGDNAETIEHMLFFCPTAKVVWKLAPVKWDGIAELQGNFWNWWVAVMQSAKEAHGLDRIQLTVSILWQVWKARNKMTFQAERGNAKLIVDKAHSEWLEYEACNETNGRPATPAEENGQSQQKWEPPKEGVIRINTDAVLSAKMVRTGLGIIARNWHGKIVKAKGIVTRRRGVPAIEEAMAIRSALEMTKNAGWTTIEVQSDCKCVVSLINSSNRQDCKLQTILDDIEDLKKNFDCCVFLFIPRTANTCSHALAQFAVKSVRIIEWEGSFPSWLSKLARKDMGVVNPFCN
ncbi:uncharacterized protein LOC113750534 [Coffea eugenioides]|uniref:uncharacterized protein LOC113750534 n=1 Tax=Coffea eugenioides TaxID=49369 RepID=UPI000F60DB6C|nr:uncharacterized protein LOC113750534 [Coffea eugenioides]